MALAMNKTFDPAQASTHELFTVFGAVLKELRARGVIRSANNPIADYAELLFEKALRLERAPKSTTGYDATDCNGAKYEIKGRRITAHNRSRQLSSIRGLDQRHFDFLAGVLFAEDFSVMRACLIPYAQVVEHSTYVGHTNSARFLLADAVWVLPGVIDVTAKLLEAEKAHG